MELSSEVLSALKALGDSSNFSDGSFKSIVEHAFKAILDEKRKNSVLEDPNLKHIDGIVLRQAYFGLIATIVEACKHGLDATSLTTFLDDTSHPPKRTATLVEAYQVYRPDLEEHHRRISFHLPRIVDIDWRLDYCIKSSQVEKINQPVYLIELTTENGDSKRDRIQFTCTMEQLQDLVSRLKDAVKCLQQHSQN